MSLPSSPIPWSGFRRRRVLFIFWCMAAFGAVFITARIGTFMLDSKLAVYSLVPDDERIIHHSCLTAYVLGAELGGQGQNVFDPTLYRDAENHNVRQSLDTGIFLQDPYQYPPPFLILPTLLLSISRDFDTLRLIWFLLQTLATLGLLVCCVSWLGGRAGLAFALTLPFVWQMPGFLVTLQMGNIHLVAILGALTAMIAFDKKRHMLGGALLSFAALAKIFPGVLVIFLLAQRRLRPVLWTAAFGVVFCLLSLPVLGIGPWVDFFSFQLPRLASGEAFAFVAMEPDAVYANMAFSALALKLEALGVDLDGALWAERMSRLFLLVVLGITVWLARRAPRDGNRPVSNLRSLQAWLVVLALGSLQSPFVPINYAHLATLLLLALFSANIKRWRVAGFPFLVLWVAVSFIFIDPMPNLVAFLIAYGFLFTSAFLIGSRAQPEAVDQGVAAGVPLAPSEPSPS